MSGKEYTARSVEEALEKALNEMMLTRDDIDYEIITQPSKGFLGFGQKDAVVKVKRKVVEELKDIVENIVEERKQEEEVDPTACVCDMEEEQEEYVAPSREEVVKKQEEEIDPTACVCDMEEEQEEYVAPAKNRTEEAAEKGKAFLAKTFEEMGLQVDIVTKEKNGYLYFDLKGENLGILIGRRGDTLDSLQFLLNLVINEKNSAKIKGIIDVENYRAKREDTLIGLSHKLAAKARKTGQKVVLEPMNPQERRIIHMALQNDRRVTTYSEGEEPYRKVVIVPNETK